MRLKLFAHVLWLWACLCYFPCAKAQSWAQAIQAGSTGNDVCKGMHGNNAGQVWITGACADTATFGTCLPAKQVGFVTGYNAAGICIANFSLPAKGAGVVTGNNGNVYALGNSNTNSAYLTAHTATADSLWQTALINIVGVKVGWLNTETLLIGGNNPATANLGNGITLQSAGSFIGVFDTLGNCQQAFSVAVGNSTLTCFDTDTNGHIYTAGFFSGQAAFGSYTLTAKGINDIFVAKYLPNGQCLWAERSGGNLPFAMGHSRDAANAIAVTPQGEVYVTGCFTDTADFGPYTLYSKGATTNDIFVAKYNHGGSLIWVQQFGAASDDEGTAIAVDGAGNCYLGGRYVFTLTIGNTALPFANNDYNLFVTKLNTNGTPVWATGAEADTWNDEVSGIVLQGNRVCVAGNFIGPANFGTHTLPGIQGGNYDIFMSSIEEPASTPNLPLTTHGLHLYPNPVINELNIELTDNNHPIAYQLFSAEGRAVTGKTQCLPPCKVPVNFLPPGIYLLSVQSPQGYSVSRVVKQ